MQATPLLHIIFYLATLFMPVPNGTTKFTISSGYDQKITWVRKADGTWQAITDTGKDAGVWSINGLSVSVVEHGITNQTDLSTFLHVEDVSGKKKHVSLRGSEVLHLVSTMTPDSILFVQEGTNNILSKGVEINYWIK
jgi:hypothetical protein